jgi:hypothetical protein
MPTGKLKRAVRPAEGKAGDAGVAGNGGEEGDDGVVGNAGGVLPGVPEPVWVEGGVAGVVELGLPCGDVVSDTPPTAVGVVPVPVVLAPAAAGATGCAPAEPEPPPPPQAVSRAQSNKGGMHRTVRDRLQLGAEVKIVVDVIGVRNMFCSWY